MFCELQIRPQVLLRILHLWQPFRDAIFVQIIRYLNLPMPCTERNGKIRMSELLRKEPYFHTIAIFVPAEKAIALHLRHMREVLTSITQAISKYPVTIVLVL